MGVQRKRTTWSWTPLQRRTSKDCSIIERTTNRRSRLRPTTFGLNSIISSHSKAVLTIEGKAFTFGLGVFGQLGHGTLGDRLRPQEIQAFTEQNISLKKITCGSYYTAAITTTGQLYSWGHGGNFSSFLIWKEYGQHGGSKNYQDWGTGENAKDKSNFHATPRPVLGLEHLDIQDVSCGHLHSIARTSDNEGNQFSCPSNSSIYLGMGFFWVFGTRRSEISTSSSSSDFSPRRTNRWRFGRLETFTCLEKRF